MNQQEFDDLASRGRYTHIPVVHEALADLDTPLSTYVKLATGPFSYLLGRGTPSSGCLPTPSCAFAATNSRSRIAAP